MGEIDDLHLFALKAGGIWDAGCRCVPEIRDCGADVSPLKEQIRRHAAKRYEAIRRLETDLRSFPGHRTPGRSSAKSSWIPARRRTIRTSNPLTAVTGMNA